MPRYFIKTFGCKVNQVESDELHAVLSAAGMQQVKFAAEADFIVVNTCTVTGEADRKVRKELRRSAGLPQVVAVVVTGCSAVLHKSELEGLDSKIKVLADKGEIPEFLLSISEELPPAINAATHALTERVRVPVKVQDGCENFCSYCIVPYARSSCRSVAASDIIARIQSLVASGVNEVVLTGINLGNYDDKRTEKDAGAKDIAALIRRIQNETELHRLRLSSIEPLHLSDDLLEILAEGSILCEHLHIPLQSGSDYVLGEMNRNYSAGEYLELVEKIRKAKPHTAITTDIIVGYPSESEDDFNQTLELVKKISFAKTHIFRYSTREGTAAARLKPLCPQLVKQRAQILQEQAEKDALHYLDSCKSRKIELIVETVCAHKNTLTGTTREYLRLELPANGHNVGEIVSISPAAAL